MLLLPRQGKLTRYNLRKFTELPFQVKSFLLFLMSFYYTAQWLQTFPCEFS